MTASVKATRSAVIQTRVLTPLTLFVQCSAQPQRELSAPRRRILQGSDALESAMALLTPPSCIAHCSPPAYQEHGASRPKSSKAHALRYTPNDYEDSHLIMRTRLTDPANFGTARHRPPDQRNFAANGSAESGLMNVPVSRPFHLTIESRLRASLCCKCGRSGFASQAWLTNLANSRDVLGLRRILPGIMAHQNIQASSMGRALGITTTSRHRRPSS